MRLDSKDKNIFSILKDVLCVCLVTQSCMTLCTPWTVACKALLSMEFSRQEYWNGLPCPRNMNLRQVLDFNF